MVWQEAPGKALPLLAQILLHAAHLSGLSHAKTAVCLLGVVASFSLRYQTKLGDKDLLFTILLVAFPTECEAFSDKKRASVHHVPLIFCYTLHFVVFSFFWGVWSAMHLQPINFSLCIPTPLHAALHWRASCEQQSLNSDNFTLSPLQEKSAKWAGAPQEAGLNHKQNSCPDTSSHQTHMGSDSTD